VVKKDALLGRANIKIYIYIYIYILDSLKFKLKVVLKKLQNLVNDIAIDGSG
jgi:hypothetical protein